MNSVHAECRPCFPKVSGHNVLNVLYYEVLYQSIIMLSAAPTCAHTISFLAKASFSRLQGHWYLGTAVLLARTRYCGYNLYTPSPAPAISRLRPDRISGSLTPPCHNTKLPISPIHSYPHINPRCLIFGCPGMLGNRIHFVI